MPGPRIESRQTACQADALTTTLPCLSHTVSDLAQSHSDLDSLPLVVTWSNAVHVVIPYYPNEESSPNLGLTYFDSVARLPSQWLERAVAQSVVGAQD